MLLNYLADAFGDIHFEKLLAETARRMLVLAQGIHDASPEQQDSIGNPQCFHFL